MLRSICYRIRCICLHHEVFQCIVSILPTNKERSAHQSWQLKWQGYAELTGTEAQVESNLETVQGSLLWVTRLSMKIMTMKTTRTRPRCWDMSKSMHIDLAAFRCPGDLHHVTANSVGLGLRRNAIQKP